MEQRLSLKSGRPSSDDLLLLASELGTSWKRLGRVLGLPEHLLEQIEEDKRELFEKCYGVLRFVYPKVLGKADNNHELFTLVFMHKKYGKNVYLRRR